MHNHGNYLSPSGPPSGVEGRAVQPDPEKYPGRLVVTFPGFKGGSYWILGLGPKVEGEYEWSIVSGESMLDLFILCRNVETFEAKYAPQVLDLVAKMGFGEDPMTAPVKSVQDGCSYPPPPSPV